MDKEYRGKLKVLKKLNPYEFEVEIYVIREGVNNNKWDYTDLEKHYMSFLGVPILCAFPKNKIGDGHNMKRVTDPKTGENYYSFIDGSCERIVGTLSDKPEDLRIVNEDGKTWLIAKGKLFTFYARELVNNIIQKGVMEVSAETDVSESHMDGDIEVFDEWCGIGVTILGEGVAPAVPGARIRELAAMQEEFNALCLRAASYNGASECHQDECRNDEKDCECHPDECKGDECSKCETAEEEKDDEDGIIEESDPVPEEKPQNQEHVNKVSTKGVENQMNLFSKRQLAELSPKFNGYTVLGAGQDEHGIHVCLMLEDGASAIYKMKDVDEEIIPQKIVKLNTKAAFNFDSEHTIEIDVCDMTDKLSAQIITNSSKLEDTQKKLDEANATIEGMRNAENRRRVNEAKKIASATLEKFNSNRETKVDQKAIESVTADIDNGIYTNSEDKEGNWIGDVQVKDKVLAACASAVMEQDAVIAREKKAKNNSHFAWDGVNGENVATTEIGALLQSFGVTE